MTAPAQVNAAATVVVGPRKGPVAISSATASCRKAMPMTTACAWRAAIFLPPISGDVMEPWLPGIVRELATLRAQGIEWPPPESDEPSSEP